MPVKLSLYARERIIVLWQQGQNVSAIVCTMKDEGLVTTCDTVQRWIFHWQEHRGLEDESRSGRPSKITAEMGAFMDCCLHEDSTTISLAFLGIFIDFCSIFSILYAL